MIRYLLFFVIGVMATSCATFQHMHYRHVKKVPASFVPLNKNQNKSFTSIIDSAQDDSTPEFSEDEMISAMPNTEVLPREFALEASVSNCIVLPGTIKNSEIINKDSADSPQPKRRDWSLLIALLLIAAGIILIGYMIILLSAPQIMLLGRILLSMFIAAAAIKMLVMGVSIFVNRFRTRKTYKES